MTVVCWPPRNRGNWATGHQGAAFEFTPRVDMTVTNARFRLIPDATVDNAKCNKKAKSESDQRRLSVGASICGATSQLS